MRGVETLERVLRPCGGVEALAPGVNVEAAEERVVCREATEREDNATADVDLKEEDSDGEDWGVVMRGPRFAGRAAGGCSVDARLGDD